MTGPGVLYTLRKRCSYLLKQGAAGTEVVKVWRGEVVVALDENAGADRGRWIDAYHHEHGFCKFVYADWVSAGGDTYPEEE